MLLSRDWKIPSVPLPCCSGGIGKSLRASEWSGIPGSTNMARRAAMFVEPAKHQARRAAMFVEPAKHQARRADMFVEPVGPTCL